MVHELPGGLPPYATFLILAGFVGATAAFLCGRRDHVGATRLIIAQGLMVLVAFAGAKIYGVVARSSSLGLFWGTTLDGYRFPGAVLSLLLLVWLVGWIVSIGPGKLLDFGAPAFGFSMATVRIGCLLTGCCAGTVCNLPWAIRFPRGSSVWAAHLRDGLVGLDAEFSVAVHPLQIYFGLYSLSLGVFLWWYFPRRKFDGQLFLMYVALQGVGKFLLEFLRYRPSPEVQYPSLGLGMAAAIALLFLSRRFPGRMISQAAPA